MQRKELLKGQLYIAGTELVRVLGTDSSPVDAEVYDFVSQTFIPKIVHPRDVNYVASRYDVVNAFEAVQAAHVLREIFAAVDLFNGRYPVGDEVTAATTSRKQTHIHQIPTLGNVKVRVPLARYNKAVNAGSLIDLGTVEIQAVVFIRFVATLGLGSGTVAPIADAAFPGIPSEHLDFEKIQAIVDEREEKSRRRRRSFEIVNVVRDERSALLKEAHPEQKSIRSNQRNDPGFKDAVIKALEAEGLTIFDYSSEGEV